jgi:hypothetical protein
VTPCWELHKGNAFDANRDTGNTAHHPGINFQWQLQRSSIDNNLNDLTVLKVKR